MLCDFPTEIDDGVCRVANVLEELSKAAGRPSAECPGRPPERPTYSEFVISSLNVRTNRVGARQAIVG